MTIDIRNWLRRVFDADLRVFELMGGEGAIKSIAEMVVRKSSMLKG